MMNSFLLQGFDLERSEDEMNVILLSTQTNSADPFFFIHSHVNSHGADPRSPQDLLTSNTGSAPLATTELVPSRGQAAGEIIGI
jgi:hypothetical protein